jgi:hypothetical protein
MKKFVKIIKKDVPVVLFIVLLSLITGCARSVTEEDTKSNDYYVAAYIWPSCHDEEMSREVLWSEGIGEWEMIKKGNPRFEGHYQPRIPLWGYKMDDDPRAWEQKIDAALDHGVNTFIFDWYWYDGKPFLESTLNNGFLKAANNDKAKFYIMWANHDVPGNMWNHFRYKSDSLIWTGEVDWDNFKIVVDRVIDQYFKKDNYFRIDNKPVFSIYSLADLVQSFKSIEETRKALDYFREKVQEAGFDGIHFQGIGRDYGGTPVLLTGEYGKGQEVNDIIGQLGLNSITLYNMAGRRPEDYIRYGAASLTLRDNWDSLLEIPFFPCVSVGWDNTPRYPDMGKESVVHYNSTPDSFETLLIKAKEYADKHQDQPKLIVINAWNEWVEGSYLEPDMMWGYGYLEAVKNVMGGKYDKYTKN